MTELLHAGATLNKTQLTEQFTYAEYLTEYGDDFIPMLVFKGKQVKIAILDKQVEPKPGWTLMSFVTEPVKEDTVSGAKVDGREAAIATIGIAEADRLP